MSKSQRSIALGIGLTLAVAGAAVADQAVDKPGGRKVADMKFGPIPGVPTCAEGAVQMGDPAKSPFILLLKAKTGCVVPWHWHSANERLMFVSGSGQIALRDENVKSELAPGAFAMLPAKHVHEFRCNQACTLYVYSDAKFDIHYVDPEGKEITPEEALKPLKEQVATAKP